MTIKILLIGYGIFASIGLGIGFIILLKHGAFNKKNNGARYLSQNKKYFNKSDFYYKAYLFLVDNFITKNYTNRIRRRIEIINPTDKGTIGRKTAKIVLRTIVSSLAILILLILIGNLSIYYICISAYIIYIINSQIVIKRLEHEEMKILYQLENFLSTLSHKYPIHKMADEAIYDSIEESAYEISVHAAIMYEILNSNDVDEEIEKYNEISPNKYLKTLLAICRTTQKFGDKIENNKSMFLNNLNYLKEEVFEEILKRRKLNAAFQYLIPIAIIPALLVNPAVSWCIHTFGDFVDFRSYYSSMLGSISIIAIYLATVIAYQFVVRLKEAGIQNKDTNHVILDFILKNSFINNQLNKEINRNYSKSNKLNETLKNLGEQINVKQFILKRVLWAFCAFIACIFIFIQIQHSQRSTALNSYRDLESSNIAANDSTMEKMKKVAELVTNKYKSNPDATLVVIENEIRNIGVLGSDALINVVAKSVKTHIEKYSNQYFRWYMLVIALLAGSYGYYLPLQMINFRKKIQQMSMEDEVMQFQSIILMLKNITRMDVLTILQWMERFANVFKNSISECINDYDKGDLDALEELKEKEPFLMFSQLVDNMINCDRIGIKDAFDEIEIRRSYFKEKRKLDNDLMIHQKATTGKRIAYVPFILLIILCLVIPFIYTAYSMLLNMASQLYGL